VKLTRNLKKNYIKAKFGGPVKLTALYAAA